ncbi:hypothetical protein SAMN04515671_1320 [Nakamurella panacisegetis]|uniref:Uncharacterized protein n=1 Tax=Nakamurella panacisegetis TaxID=1090615 RepID=A0A1H0KIZ7_9ACTN|nr:hypothetical protein [Nakamurella panacisegetis]SDO55702.1 hypothetical protein SAMN04515671_1320 [Nakamurella panacisegetis]
MTVLTITRNRFADRHRPAHRWAGESAGRHVSHLGLGLAADRDEWGTVRRLHGLRHGRKVEIRLPDDDVESVTWVLCALPKFKTVLGSGALPTDVATAVGDVPFLAPIWNGLQLQGGEDGLIAVRVGESSLPDAFLHDLWLLERIADNLGLLPIPAGDLGLVAPPVTWPSRPVAVALAG